MDGLLEVADTLYAGPPEQFTAERTAIEKAARTAGDKELAAAVKALKRPSVGAWAVNLLVRREGPQIDQALALAEALRGAAEALDGEELRALTRQRRQLTGALTIRARQLALEHGTRLSRVVADQVEGTLSAAMRAPRAADAVRTGLLVTTLSATGVDETSFGSAVAVPTALGTRVPPAGSGQPTLRVVPVNKRVAREAAEERLTEAQAELDAGEETVDRAQQALADLQGTRFQLRSEIDELQRRIAENEDHVESVDDQIEVAEQDRDDAEAALHRARAAHEVARRGLETLDGG